MMSVMLGLIGLTFYILLSEVYKTDYSCLIFSTAYAFIGYLMGYFNCTLYYFNVMMYPLVMLGIYRIVKNKKISYLYIFSMFLTIFSSYYIGYMTCISSVFFGFLFLCIVPVSLEKFPFFFISRIMSRYSAIPFSLTFPVPFGIILHQLIENL